MTVAVQDYTTVDILRDIIINQMDLVSSRVNVYNQKFDIPSDKFLFVTVGYKFSKVYSSRNYTSISLPFTETQDVNTQEYLYIDLFSRGLEALQRKEEVIEALYSIYSQQQQEANTFRIFRIADIKDLSYLEGNAILYRYEIPIIIFRCYQKTKTPSYYDTFSTFYRANDGQPDMIGTFNPSTNPDPLP
jgi:hypothetical protein